MISFEELYQRIQSSSNPVEELEVLLWNWYDQGYYDCAEDCVGRD